MTVRPDDRDDLQEPAVVRPAQIVAEAPLEVALPVPGAALASLRIVDPAAACFLIVPALGTPARSYRKLCEAIAELRLNSISFDLRGMGSSQLRAGRRHDWGYDDLVEQELCAVFDLARQHLHAQARVYWVGHSLGGQLALLHQRHCAHQRADGVALIASGSPWRGHYPARIRLGLAALRSIIALSGATIGYFPGDRVGFGGRQPARLMRQWSRFARDGRLPEWRPADPERSNHGITGMSLLAMQADSWAPERSMRALASEAGVAEKQTDTLHRLPDGSAADHFSWMRQPGPVARWLHRFAATPLGESHSSMA